MAIIDSIYLENIIEEIKNGKTNYQENKLAKLKFGIPPWLRKIVFSAFNPFYVFYTFIGLQKKLKTEFRVKNIYFSLDFLIYGLKNKASIDLDEYFSENDQNEIIRFVKNRVKSCFNTKLYYKDLCQDGAILAKIKLAEKKLFKRMGSNYIWKTNGTKYIIPSIPEPSCYYYLQGISILPEKITESLKNKLFISIGAYWGDTAISLLSYNPATIWCFEPEQVNYDVLLKVIENNKLQDRIKAYKFGIGNVNKVQSISSYGGSSLMSDEGEEKIEVRNLDSFMNEVEKEIGLIKMDIEGWEYYALQGAKEIIMKYKPVLAISLYHTGQDFFNIPPLLKSYCPEYNFRFVNLAPDELNEKILLAYVNS